MGDLALAAIDPSFGHGLHLLLCVINDDRSLKASDKLVISVAVTAIGDPARCQVTVEPLTAALGTTVQGMMDSPAARSLLRSMFDEVMALAAVEGVALDADEVWAHTMRTYEDVGPHHTSMAADVAAGRRSEIDSFCIEISRRAADHGVAVPTHDTIGALIVAREEERGLR